MEEDEITNNNNNDQEERETTQSEDGNGDKSGTREDERVEAAANIDQGHINADQVNFGPPGGTQFNVLEGNVTVSIQSEQKSPADEDPTEDFQQESFIKAYPDAEAITLYAQKLASNRLVLLHCADKDALDSAVYSLTRSSQFDKTVIRYLSPKRIEGDSDNLESNGKQWKSDSIKAGSTPKAKTAVDSLDDLLRRTINNGKPALIVVYLKSIPFLNSLFSDERQEALQYFERLRAAQIYLLIKFDSESLFRHLENNLNNLHFPYWVVSRLHFLLKQHFGEEQARFYQQKLLEQMNKGLWRNTSDENSLSKSVQIYLNLGKSAFLKTFNDREAFANSSIEDVEQFLAECVETITPQQIIKDEDPVTQHIAFLGTFFEGLTVQEFNDLAIGFLSDPAKQITKKTNKTILHPGGSTEQIEEDISESCLVIWSREKDKYLRQAQLRPARLDSQTICVDFQESYLRPVLQEYFEEEFPFYTQEQFNQIFSFTFSKVKASDTLIANLAKLNARMAANDTGSGLERLTEISFTVQIADDKQEEKFQRIDDLQTFLHFIGENEQYKQVKRIWFHRLYLLISEYMNYPRLRDVVEEFINWLFFVRNYDLIIFLIGRLWNSPHFSPIHWVQQVLERGVEDAKKAAFKLLLESAINEMTNKTWDYFTEIKSWLPDKEKTLGEYSRTNEYGLVFQFHFVKYITGLNVANLERYPLLTPLITGESTATRQIDLLTDWLFHPGLEHALYRVHEQEVFKTPGPVRAFVVDSLGRLILSGEGIMTDKNKPLIDHFIESIKKDSNLKSYRELIRYLQYRANMYREEFIKIPPANSLARNQKKAELEIVKLIAKLLQENNPS